MTNMFKSPGDIVVNDARLVRLLTDPFAKIFCHRHIRLVQILEFAFYFYE